MANRKSPGIRIPLMGVSAKPIERELCVVHHSVDLKDEVAGTKPENATCVSASRIAHTVTTPPGVPSRLSIRLTSPTLCVRATTRFPAHTVRFSARRWSMIPTMAARSITRSNEHFDCRIEGSRNQFVEWLNGITALLPPKSSVPSIFWGITSWKDHRFLSSGTFPVQPGSGRAGC